MSGGRQNLGVRKTVELGAVVFSLLLWSCGGDSTPTAPTPTPVATSITLSVTRLSLASLGATSQHPLIMPKFHAFLSDRNTTSG